jgi:hypothetical protein
MAELFRAVGSVAAGGLRSSLAASAAAARARLTTAGVAGVDFAGAACASSGTLRRALWSMVTTAARSIGAAFARFRGGRL